MVIYDIHQQGIVNEKVYVTFYVLGNVIYEQEIVGAQDGSLWYTHICIQPARCLTICYDSDLSI